MAPTGYRGRELASDLPMPVASLGSIVLAAGLVAVRGEGWRTLVMFALLAPLPGSALVGGLRSAVATAVVAAASFNFFHLAPYGVLDLGVQELAAVAPDGSAPVTGAPHSVGAQGHTRQRLLRR